MSSQMLLKARSYEASAVANIPENDRPDGVLTPPCGWMNDPNGFSYYKGRCHLFFQYYPYEPRWGLMHWGHAVSDDLLHWGYLPCALAPDMPYDKDGCFSGSAITLPDGRHALYYTGVTEADKLQVQCLALGDGRDYEKYEGNPIIDESMLPDGASKKDFRDPKVFLDMDGIYKMIVSGRGANGNGQLFLFESKDSFGWTFASVFLENTRQKGKMWECPDFFRLGDWDIVLVSPMDGLPEALFGQFDRSEKRFVIDHAETIDAGPKFYAPQTTETFSGERVMIAWAENWADVQSADSDAPFRGQMTRPRILTMEHGRFLQKEIGANGGSL